MIYLQKVYLNPDRSSIWKNYNLKSLMMEKNARWYEVLVIVSGNMQKKTY